SEIALDIGAKIIGVNCRNLKTLEIDKNTFELILPILPQSIVKVAESGIGARSDVERVAQLGANAAQALPGVAARVPGRKRFLPYRH
ncbi:MAG: indole-3-glycerol-phosphate synthase TrpC, partial [Acetobacteraceae bacterium]|nr:indole-3-glycerol-phosphate synthase TrpC [Acetobacteraceae bacterium]